MAFDKAFIWHSETIQIHLNKMYASHKNHGACSNKIKWFLTKNWVHFIFSISVSFISFIYAYEIDSFIASLICLLNSHCMAIFSLTLFRFFGLNFLSDSNISFIMRSTFARGLFFLFTVVLHVENKKNCWFVRNRTRCWDIFFSRHVCRRPDNTAFLISEYFSLFVLFQISEFPLILFHIVVFHDFFSCWHKFHFRIPARYLYYFFGISYLFMLSS